MCWKSNPPAPQPTPAAMQIPSATQATPIEGAVSCPANTYSCNSTDPNFMCHNGGLVCCLDNSEEQICACVKPYQPTNCLFHEDPDLLLDASSGFDSMSSAGKAGIIVFIVLVVLAFVITVVVLVVRRQRKRRSGRPGGHSAEPAETVALSGNVDVEKHDQRNADVGRGANGSGRNGS